MDIAIVTGASSSLGVAISSRLIDLGFRVYGLGGDYKNCSLNNSNFKPLACDLTDAKAIEAACQSILAKEKGVSLVVNNAKFFGRRPFREMDVAEMEAILKINLLAPLVLVKCLTETLRSLQGTLIQIGPISSQTSSAGAAGAAAAGGLKWMGEALFHELRDAGIKVCHLAPEPNRQRDVSVGNFGQPGRKESVIDPEAIANAVEQLLQNPYGNTITEMVIRPLRTHERTEPAVVRLPRPEQQPIPYTVPREFIEAEDQLEEEEWLEKNREKRRRRDERKQQRQNSSKQAEEPSDSKPTVPAQQQSATEPKTDSAPSPHTDPAPLPDTAPQRVAAVSAAGSADPAKRRKTRRKPKPPMEKVGFLDRVPPAASAPTKPAAVPAELNKATAQTEDAKKVATKKVATKKVAAKKVAVKKVAVKKAVAKVTADSVAEKEEPAKKAATKAAKKATKTVAKKAARKTVQKAAETVSGKSPGSDAAVKKAAKKQSGKKVAK